MNKTMKSLFKYSLVLGAVLMLTACNHHAEEPFKPIEKRTVLFLTNKGEIYNQNRELVRQLPGCIYASQIISDGDDYFVSGTNENERVGYWKNGKWNTLHVDFIDDVDHWIDGIGKWEYYIYLLDYPNVLKNSGIFPLEDADKFLPAKEALFVSDGKCYVVGQKRTKESGSNYLPVIYHEHKGKYTPEMLPIPDGAKDGYCTCVYAYDGTRTLVGGSADGWPVIWVDKQLQILPLTDYDYGTYLDEDVVIGEVHSVTECEGDIYAVGVEHAGKYPLVATLWHNGVIEHLVYDTEHAKWTESFEVKTYGSDVYVVTLEYSYDSKGELVTTSVLWVNGKVVNAYPGLATTSFTVL